jgi:hypothetical protein
MKTKSKFIVTESWNQRHWPDEARDIYQIRLPYFSEKSLAPNQCHPEMCVGEVSALTCGIGGILDPRSPKWLRRAIEVLARYFRREFSYDFCQYSALEYTDKDEHRAYFWLSRSHPDWASGKGEIYPLVGACCFRRRHYQNDPLPPGIPADCYALQWIWFHPYERHQGHLTGALPYFLARFGKLFSEGPFSPAFDCFLRKHRQWPYQTPEQRSPALKQLFHRSGQLSPQTPTPALPL